MQNKTKPHISLSPIGQIERKHALSQQQLFQTKKTEKQILYSMDEDTYEELVASWAYSCLKGKYSEVYRIGGAGDHGVDVLARFDNSNESDIYQCKHYNAPLNASVVLPEICKMLYFVYLNELPMPHKYFFVAPKNLNASMLKLVSKPDSLRDEVLDKWNKYSNKISDTLDTKLTDDIKSFIIKFDFRKFQVIAPDGFLERLRENKNLYHQYFGVRKENIKRIETPTPKDVQGLEATYVTHLIDAYNSVSERTEITANDISSTSFSNHFSRARECYWLAESLRKMSEENSPGDKDEFEEFKKDMEIHVADTYESDYENGFERNKAVIAESKSFMPKLERIISGEISSGEKIGVCYHLSNDNKLIWIRE